MEVDVTSVPYDSRFSFGNSVSSFSDTQSHARYVQFRIIQHDVNQDYFKILLSFCPDQFAIFRRRKHRFNTDCLMMGVDGCLKPFLDATDGL
jgi:hypothetical protein